VKYFLTVGFLVVVLLVSGCGAPPVEADMTLQEFTDHLEGRAIRLMDRYEVPGMAIALVRGGETVWSGACGYADVAEGRPMTVDTLCRVESISKPVTARGVMNLVEQGLIELDNPLKTYLPAWNISDPDYDLRQVTVRRLLSDTSGIGLGTIGDEYPPGSDMPSLEEYLAGEIRFARPPASGFLYSNVAFNTLELLIEEVTGRDFSEYMAAEVLGPLGMTQSSFSRDRELYIVSSTVDLEYILPLVRNIITCFLFSL